MTKQLSETLANQEPRQEFRRALQIWFRPQDVINLGTLALAALENKKIQRILLAEYGMTLPELEELVLKMNKEVERV